VPTARASARDALVDAALAEFSERGYEAATVAGIAARAGVTTGALYAHFGGKAQLLVATIGLARPDEYAATLARAMTLPLSELLDVLEGDMALSGRRRLLLLDVIVVARRDPEVAVMLRQGFESYLSVTVAAIEQGIAAGALDPLLEPAQLARVGAAVSLGNLVLEALGEGAADRRAIVRLTDALLRTDRDASTDDDPALARVRARAAEVDDASDALHHAIAAAAAAGHSLRRIGAAAGLSHERVRRVLSTTLTTEA
jgi:AcrR family transcriptional regulator